MVASLIIAKTILITGLAVWASILTLNNIRDKETNKKLVSEMMSMSRIKDNPEEGGSMLLNRAITSTAVHKATIYLAILIQLVIICLLWYTVYLFIHSFTGGHDTGETIKSAVIFANFSFSAMFVLWFLFLCGGLWHAYWIKMWDVQQVHMTMLIITILSIIFVNYKVI